MSGRSVKLSRRLAASALGLLTLLLMACPPPVTIALLSKHKDIVGPRVTISSPTEGSSYPSTVVVTGFVSDTSDATGTAGAVASLRYDLTPATIPGADVTTALASSGSFTFQFPTTGFSGTMVLTVTATDWNGNTNGSSITLLNQGAIPSFGALPANHQVTVSWSAVPLAQSYSLYYTTNGSIPSSTNGTQLNNVTSPRVIGGLSNGSLCVFLLQAHSSSGSDNWSNPVQSIPLSTRSLTTRARGAYGNIRLEWNAIPAAVGFEVWRSTTRLSGFVNVSGTVAGTSWVDTGVSDGQIYYYEVRPSVSGSAASEPAGGQTVPFPSAAFARVGFSSPPGQLARVVVQGAYAYAASLGSYFKGLQVFDISDPIHPVLAGELSLGVDCYGIAVQGAYAYVGDLSSQLHVIDISDPRNPSAVGSAVPTAGPVWGAAIGGSYLYLACGQAQRFDISNPALPAAPVAYNPGDTANAIAVSGSNVYVAFGGSLRILNPLTMALVGTFPGLTWARDIAVSGNYAYIADENGNKLWLVNVSAPSLPTGASFALGMGVKAVAMRGSTVCLTGDVSAGGFAFKMVNVQNPALPVVIAGVSLPSGGEGMAISGNYAYVGDMGFGLQAVDIRNPSAPQLSGSAGIPGTFALALDGDQILATSLSTNGLKLFNVSTPSFPLSWAPSPPQGPRTVWPSAVTTPWWLKPASWKW